MASPQDVANRIPITVCLMLATLMNSLDGTIANVALPHMQGSFSASQDQMTWVLTSYIVATAIMTPLTGWLAGRFGAEQVFLVSIAGFTVASMLCGSATNLAQIVVYRLLQGLCGASLMPLSQSVMLDLFPPQQVGQVMAIWGAGALLGPIFGPLLGGWLTDNFSWRWVFYINLPVGVLAFAGVWLFMSKGGGARGRRLDFLGYGALVAFVAGLQLVLDRGPTQDWFSSREVWAEAILAAIGLYLFVMQTLTARQPFFDRALLRDRNFLAGNLFGVALSVLLFSTMALQPPLMQGLMGYPVFAAGMAMMPRGVGSFVSMLAVGRVIGRIDSRVLLGLGLGASGVALFQMSHFSLDMTVTPFVVSGIIQGLGMGFMFVPMTVLTFATLGPALRPEGASAYALVRSLGQSVGISVMEATFTRQAAVSHADLAAKVQPGNPAFGDFFSRVNPMTSGGLEGLNVEITRQSAMVGYIDVFHLMSVVALAMIPLVLLLRPPKQARELAAMPVE
ncbi:MAG: DHA2 family efflux MFS transporter permease subunit [Caulobacteraceae bacterium]|nr:DHA2 family efflux MFS transporter permease subunit [Caulobacteraceae bacterium]